MFNQLFGNPKKRKILPDLTVDKIKSYYKWEKAQNLDQVYQAMLNGRSLHFQHGGIDHPIQYFASSVHLTDVNNYKQIIYFSPNYQITGKGKGIRKNFDDGYFEVILNNGVRTGQILISPIFPTQSKVKWYLNRIYYIFSIIRRAPSYTPIIIHLISQKRFDQLNKPLLYQGILFAAIGLSGIFMKQPDIYSYLSGFLAGFGVAAIII